MIWILPCISSTSRQPDRARRSRRRLKRWCQLRRTEHAPISTARRCNIICRQHFSTAPVRTRSSKCRSEEHTSELQSLMRISYAVFCLKKNKLHLLYHYL